MLRTPRTRFAALLAVLGLVLAGTAIPASAATGYGVSALYFTVKVGPANQRCLVVGDLYWPRSASTRNRLPAILTTNGFGGSKADQAGIGKAFASRGYVVLSYSGLGFGGSGCKIDLDNPETDGKAASQLVSYLAGATGMAYLDAKRTKPAPALNIVKLDKAGDPRVGMVGGSYGGQVQYAAASLDRRIDTIVPLITWADLSYSLSPNNTSQVNGVSTAVPGAAKLLWALGFSLIGIQRGLENAQSDPNRLLGCPNFADFVCPGLVLSGTLGHVDNATIAQLRKRSVASYLDKIKIPTLIIQGQADTLFNLNEGVAVYQGLRSRKIPTKMIWFSGGHSADAVPGDVNFASPNPSNQYVTARIAGWFDYYLKKDKKAATGPNFSYFRPWVKYSGSTYRAYGHGNFPAGKYSSFYLSGAGLTTKAAAIAKGSQQFLTPVAGVPTSSDPADVLGALAGVSTPEQDLPGTFASWSSSVLSKNIDVVGSPVLTLKVDAPTVVPVQGVVSSKLVLFAKILDSGPSGNKLIGNLIAPVRVPDVTKPFKVTMPAFVHRFAPGHRIKLVVAGGSLNYRGGLVANPVTITTGSTGQVLQLPLTP